MVDSLLARIDPAMLATAIELAELPDEIRGFGYIKDANLAKAEAKKATLLAKLAAPAEPELIAAE